MILQKKKNKNKNVLFWHLCRDIKCLRKGKSVRNVEKIRIPDKGKELGQEFEKALSAM